MRLGGDAALGFTDKKLASAVAVLPGPVHLEELDKFKKGNDQINFHAREFTRELDKISGDSLLSEGIPLGDKLGSLFIETGKEFSERVNQSFPEKTADHRILAIADYVI